ncbi:hypothetical protein [Granulicella sp. dw_53]|uniref:hypothetical protein n=1 Tax=Granulicella sp. dw_53 TaxID=2719792 RepID=UPI001BD548A8|nr:hypothetical protein [Granulicella sp. dw_53]
MIIDAKGLFEGQRLAACSTQTQYCWLRLIHAANNFGRLELHYPTIIAKYFRYIPDPPTEDQFISVIQELQLNCLVVVYLAGEHWWLQFITPDKALLVYKNAEDRRSPEPPTKIMEAFATRYQRWKDQRNAGDARISETFSKSFGNVSEKFCAGVGVVEGVVGGEGEGPSTSARSDKKPRSMLEDVTVFNLPVIGGKDKYGVPQRLYNEYVKAFPGISVMDELGKMRVWLLSNPTRMKTPRGMPRFVNSWLSKAQDNQPQQHGGRNNGALPFGKADSNLVVLAESLHRGERQDQPRSHGLLSAGGDGPDDLRDLRAGALDGNRPEGSAGRSRGSK